jgi:hypothetical protein
VRKTDCKRLNDNAAVFEITLHVQSSAVGGVTGGQVAEYVWKWADTTMEGDNSRHGWERRNNWPLTLGAGLRVILGTRVHLRRRNSWKQKTKLAAPGTNNQGATVLAAAHPCTSHPF